MITLIMIMTCGFPGQNVVDKFFRHSLNKNTVYSHSAGPHTRDINDDIEDIDDYNDA